MINRIYDDLPSMMGELKVDLEILETMILNGGNTKANRYLEDAIQSMKRALSDMSDAEFEITTSPIELGDDDDTLVE